MDWLALLAIWLEALAICDALSLSLMLITLMGWLDAAGYGEKEGRSGV